MHSINRPADPITIKEAAHILGASRLRVQRMMLAGLLRSHGPRQEHRLMSRAEVERMAAQIYVWRDHLDDPTSYWVTGREAGAVLGVSAARVSQLATAGDLPFVWHASRVRMFRRHQLERVAGGSASMDDDPWCWFMTSDKHAATLREQLADSGFRGVQVSQGRLVSLIMVPAGEERLDEIRELLAQHQEVLKGPVRLSTI